MQESAPALPTPAVIKPAADLLGGSTLGRHFWWNGRRDHGRGWEPAEPLLVSVPWALWCRMVILQAKGTSGYGTSPARKSLVVQARVRHGPVQIFAGEGFTPELPVISYPTLPLVVSFGPNHCCLVGKKFWGLLRELGNQHSCHQ